MRRAFVWLTDDVRRALVAVIVVTTVVVVAFSNGHEPEAVDPGAPIERDATPSPTVTTSASPEPSPAATGARGAVEVTRRYLAAFFDQGSTDAQWRARSARYSTPTLADLNEGVPREVVPHLSTLRVKVTGAKIDYAELRATMTGGMVLHVATVKIDGRWLVDEVAPE